MTQKHKQSLLLAVIDIGSNSVRMVIYDMSSRRPAVLRQKKVRCGLAKGLRNDHLHLNPRSVALTLKTLASFRTILDKNDVRSVCAIATAASRLVKKTPQGKTFHHRAEKALGHKISIISGKREAELGAKGVRVGWPHATGICGDFGGGSLELAQLKNGRIVHAVSLPLGSLTLMAEAEAKPMEAVSYLRQRLKQVNWLHHKKPVFYPIGGSWRTVARVLRKQQGATSPLVHGYTVTAAKVAPAIKIMAANDASAFKKMGRKIRRRAKLIPVAAMVLSELITLIQPYRIIFSSYGIREGIFSEHRMVG